MWEFHGTSPNLNVMVQLDFELVYNDFTVKLVILYGSGTNPGVKYNDRD